jgi:hypothetical protein
LRDRAVQSFRIVLTIIGLVLFAVYSVRATSASTDRKVSGLHRFAVVTDHEDLATLLASGPATQAGPEQSVADTSSHNLGVSPRPASTKHPKSGPSARHQSVHPQPKAEQAIAELVPSTRQR